MQKNIKMVVTDLDNTLLNNSSEISDYTKSILARCRRRGIKIAYATARDAGATDRAMNALFDGAVCSNGAQAYIGDALIHSRVVSPAHLHGLLAAAEEAGIELDIEPERILVIDADESLDAAAIIRRHLPEELHLLVREQGLVLVVLHREASKSGGTAALAAHWGIAPAEIAAFGDDTIDIDLLAYCGIGVAVANAPAQVKAAADFICGSNEEDGVARWIEEHVLSIPTKRD
ncbi:MAG: HAD family hydrolase [Oscillospiraceae bacterium]|nr:HAD family hydrolase [Oscillospiraceae bacterium]